MKKITSFLILLVISTYMISCNTGGTKKQDPKNGKPEVSVVFPVTIDAFDHLKQGLKETTGQKFDIRFYSAEGDPAKFETAIQSALINKPNYLITIGTQITNTAFGPKFKNDLPTVIAGAISLPAQVDGLVNVGISPPRKTSVAIISDNPKESIYELFNKALKGFLPNVKKVGILYNPAEINSKGTANDISVVLKRNNVIVVDGVINNAEDIERITDRLLLENVEAIIISHDKNAVTKATSIVKKCDEKHIPVFSLDDGTVIKDGVCVGVSVNYKIVGILIGQTLLKIANKEVNAGDLPIISIENARIYVNTKKLNDLGLKQPESLGSLIEKIR